MKSMLKRIKITSAMRLLALLAIVAGTAIRPMPVHALASCYVDASATGFDLGSSWEHAWLNLQDALVEPGCTEIWVAQGVYKPGATASDSFVILPGAAVYGGFANGDDFGDRDPLAKVTVLSGDIDNNDLLDADGVTLWYTDITGTNSYRVVKMDGTGTPISATTVLDGFTITGAHNTQGSFPDYLGAGMYCDGSGAGSVCSPTLANLGFYGNDSNYAGGGLYLNGSAGGYSSPVLTSVNLSGNHAFFYGGGMYSFGYDGGVSSPTLIDVIIASNAAGESGGGMYNNGHDGGSSPDLINVTFGSNTAGWKGGAMYNAGVLTGVSNPTLNDVDFFGNSTAGVGGPGGGGAIYNDAFQGVSSPNLTRVLFQGNHADGDGTKGGAIFNDGNDGTSSPTLTDAIFLSNYADYGGAMYNYSTPFGTSSPEITNAEFELNSATGFGGAIENATNNGTSSPTLVNVTFGTNSALGGGAIANDAVAGGNSSPLLFNVTFTGNTAATGGAVWNTQSGGSTVAPILTNVILWDDEGTTSDPEVWNGSGTGPVISYSVVEGTCASITGATCGAGNLDTDPMLGALQDNGGFPNTIALHAGSSAIDAADGAMCPEYDPRGVWRFQWAGGACDIGAYERLPDPAAFSDAYISDVVLYRGGAWVFHDFATGLYLGGSSKWTGNPGGACIPAPMDYDGDGDKDFTQLCSGAWNFYDDGGVLVKGIWVGNIAGLKPVPADYDGDGTDDVVVFNAGGWNKYNYTTGLYDSGVWTGNPGGIGVPAPMDYDGNGTADPTILSGGAWHFYNANGSYNKGIWVGNVAGQLPVPGDYYGDAIDDVMVFRGGAWLPYDFSTGMFLVADSVWTGNPPPPVGGGATKPAPIDYDDDGTLDFTVFAGGPWHFYNDNGSYNKGIWVGKNVVDVPMSRRLLP